MSASVASITGHSPSFQSKRHVKTGSVSRYQHTKYDLMSTEEDQADTKVLSVWNTPMATRIRKLSEADSVLHGGDAGTRFPKIEDCAHFHYDFVEIGRIEVSLAENNLELDSQSESWLYFNVTSHERHWTIRRTYDSMHAMDAQLHRCIYDRKFSLLPELTKDLIEEEGPVRALGKISAYFVRFSAIASNMINCGPVLSWIEMDNRGHRLLLSDTESAINTPAVGAAHAVRRYVAQTQDELSFEVGDILSIISKPPPSESAWWRGKKNFEVGFFPSDCVEMICDNNIPETVANKLPPPLPKPVLRKKGKFISVLRAFFSSRPARSQLKRSGIVKERVFGCDLGEHLLNSGLQVPLVLTQCSQVIESHGIVDGIYRLSGVASNIQKLRNEFDGNEVRSLTEDLYMQDIHSISSLLKMYFRELPNPLLTYQLYDQFSDVIRINDGIRLTAMRHVVQQLPPPHHRTAEFLFQHLARVATHSKETSMTVRNLALVWAPNLLRSKELEQMTTGTAALSGVGLQAIITEYLILHVNKLFDKSSGSGGSIRDVPSVSVRPPRPRSLAITSPATLLSLEEAQERALGNIDTQKQRFIEVGAGPAALPEYHTVIDIPKNRKSHSRRSSGWKSIFSKSRSTSLKDDIGSSDTPKFGRSIAGENYKMISEDSATAPSSTIATPTSTNKKMRSADPLTASISSRHASNSSTAWLDGKRRSVSCDIPLVSAAGIGTASENENYVLREMTPDVDVSNSLGLPRKRSLRRQQRADSVDVSTTDLQQLQLSAPSSTADVRSHVAGSEMSGFGIRTVVSPLTSPQSQQNLLTTYGNGIDAKANSMHLVYSPTFYTSSDANDDRFYMSCPNSPSQTTNTHFPRQLTALVSSEIEASQSARSTVSTRTVPEILTTVNLAQASPPIDLTQPSLVQSITMTSPPISPPMLTAIDTPPSCKSPLFKVRQKAPAMSTSQSNDEDSFLSWTSTHSNDLVSELTNTIDRRMGSGASVNIIQPATLSHCASVPLSHGDKFQSKFKRRSHDHDEIDSDGMETSKIDSLPDEIRSDNSPSNEFSQSASVSSNNNPCVLTEAVISTKTADMNVASDARYRNDSIGPKSVPAENPNYFQKETQCRMLTKEYMQPALTTDVFKEVDFVKTRNSIAACDKQLNHSSSFPLFDANVNSRLNSTKAEETTENAAAARSVRSPSLRVQSNNSQDAKSALLLQSKPFISLTDTVDGEIKQSKSNATTAVHRPSLPVMQRGNSVGYSGFMMPKTVTKTLPSPIKSLSSDTSKSVSQRNGEVQLASVVAAEPVSMAKDNKQNSNDYMQGISTQSQSGTDNNSNKIKGEEKATKFVAKKCSSFDLENSEPSFDLSGTRMTRTKSVKELKSQFESDNVDDVTDSGVRQPVNPSRSRYGSLSSAPGTNTIPHIPTVPEGVQFKAKNTGLPSDIQQCPKIEVHADKSKKVLPSSKSMDYVLSVPYTSATLPREYYLPLKPNGQNLITESLRNDHNQIAVPPSSSDNTTSALYTENTRSFRKRASEGGGSVYRVGTGSDFISKPYERRKQEQSLREAKALGPVSQSSRFTRADSGNSSGNENMVHSRLLPFGSTELTAEQYSDILRRSLRQSSHHSESSAVTANNNVIPTTPATVHITMVPRVGTATKGKFATRASSIIASTNYHGVEVSVGRDLQASVSTGIGNDMLKNRKKAFE